MGISPFPMPHCHAGLTTELGFFPQPLSSATSRRGNYKERMSPLGAAAKRKRKRMF